MNPLPSSPPRSSSGRRKGPWSQSEIERLKRLFGLRQDGVIARELNRSVESVRRMARRVFSGEERTGPWSAREVQALKNYLGAANMETVSLVLRRPPVEIQRKVVELESQVKSRSWTPEDTQALKRLYGTRFNSDLVLILGRPEADIEIKATSFCLAKDKGFRRRSGKGGTVRMPRWTPEAVDKLCEIYSTTPNLEIARILDRSVKSVVSKAHDLALKKSPDRLRRMGRENVQIRYDRKSQQATE